VFEHGFEPDPPPADVELVALFTDPARVLLPARHRLAARPELAVADLAGETWIRAHGGSAARLVDHVLARAGLRPPLLLAGHGDEPVESQVYVVAGDGVVLAYQLNVIINPAEIAVRPLRGPARSATSRPPCCAASAPPGRWPCWKCWASWPRPASGGRAASAGAGRGGAS
jgi:DNA-binding transcriptional LysR family regulator